jgi:cathepsin B
MVKVGIVLLISVAFANVAFEPASQVMTQETVDMINNNPGTKWQASKSWVGDMTVDEAKAYLGTDLSVPNPFPKRNFGALHDYLSVPDSFDSRTQWPDCIHPIRNQERCGSCWAFSASEVLSDRFCIAKNVNVVLSPQWLVSCDNSNLGCNGGNLPLVWQYMESTGIPTDACDPYISGGGDSHTGTCSHQC